jgi:rfaE bifunctional protein kinase chain/domain
VNKEKKDLIQLIDNFSDKKIGVWGDFILDEYIFGNTSRISREAPVLILSYQDRMLSLGGAGNSLKNLKALGADPVPIGVVGSDDPGRKIHQMIKKEEISVEHLHTHKNYQTAIKTRILAGEENTRKQQILRIDQEGKVPESGDLKKKIQNSLRNLDTRLNALLISDYNYFTVKKDIFDRVLQDFKKNHIPVTLDSRFRLLNFKGFTVATPNIPEVEGALHIEIDDDKHALAQSGKLLLRKTQAAALLVTRGSRGMVLFEKKKQPLFTPIHGTTDIVDVTGAGDTVISVFTLALASGGSFKQAASLANYAGGIVVMKKGTATLSPEELKEAISSKN